MSPTVLAFVRDSPMLSSCCWLVDKQSCKTIPSGGRPCKILYNRVVAIRVLVVACDIVVDIFVVSVVLNFVRVSPICSSCCWLVGQHTCKTVPSGGR